MSALLTNSRLRTARSCSREQHIRYDLGYAPVESNEEAPAFLGSLVHFGLEAWFSWLKSRQAGQAADGALEAMMARIHEEVADPFVMVKAEVMLTGYHFRWIEDAEHFEVLAVEAEFRTKLINPDTGATSRTWELAGKLDAVIRDRRTGKTFVVEHKTSSEDISPGSDYWKRLRIDSQVSTYFDGAAALGFEVDACVYDVLQTPSQKPLKATPVEARKYTQKTGALYASQRADDEGPEEYKARILEKMLEDPTAFYARGEVVRLEKELHDARNDAWDLGRVIRENQLADRHPRNPDACMRFGRRCPFWGVCTGEASLQDTTQFTHVENVHPELERVTQPEQPAKEAGNQ